MVGVVEVSQARDTVSRVAAGFDPLLVAIADAEQIVVYAAAIKNMAATIESLAAARVAEGPAWRQTGFKTAAEWLASRSGTSVGKAKEAIETGKRLESQPATSAAARAGALSAEQTAAISDAAAADPEAEEQLVEAAGTTSLSDLKERCAKTKAAADPNPDATHARIQRERRLRFFPDAGGGHNLSGRTTADQIAPIKAAVDDLVGEIYAAARANGVHEERDAYCMDALAEICRRHFGTSEPVTDRPARRVKHLGVIRVDLEALRRGIAEQGETCEIAGVGPIPVSTARELLGDAALHLVITRGVDVANVTSLSRSPTVAMRIALHWQQPKCKVLGCNRPVAEIDHRDDYARIRCTTLANLDGYCDHHHDLKTYKGWALVPGTGRRPMVPPDHPLHPHYKGHSTAPAGPDP